MPNKKKNKKCKSISAHRTLPISTPPTPPAPPPSHTQLTDPPISTPQFSHTQYTTMHVITVDEHMSLLKAREENAALKAQLCSMSIKVAELTETISNNNSELELLRAENALLRKTIKNHEDALALQFTKIDSMQLEINRLLYREQLKNYRLVLQDINRAYKVEARMSRPYKTGLAGLRRDRNAEFHILNEEDSEEFNLYKTVLLLDKLKHLPTAIRSQLEHKCPGLIKEFIRCIGTIQLPSLSEDDAAYAKADVDELMLD